MKRLAEYQIRSKKVWEEIKNKNRGLIIYHWDADGLASAALAKKKINELGKRVVFSPAPLNQYHLSDEELGKISKLASSSDFVMIVDYNLPTNDILRLKNMINSDVFVFDHHFHEGISENWYINPVNDARSGLMFPGCSWLMGEFFENRPLFLSLLGTIGDQEEKILENNYFQIPIKQLKEKFKLTYSEVDQIVKLLETAYIMGDRNLLKSEVDWLLKYESDPKKILEDQKLNSNYEAVAKAIEVAAAAKPYYENGPIKYFELKSDYNIISPVTRSLARQYAENVVGVIKKEPEDLINIYLRRRNLSVDLRKIISLAKDQGYSAGGKVEVAGIFLPAEDCDQFLEKVNQVING